MKINHVVGFGVLAIALSGCGRLVFQGNFPPVTGTRTDLASAGCYLTFGTSPSIECRALNQAEKLEVQKMYFSPLSRKLGALEAELQLYLRQQNAMVSYYHSPENASDHVLVREALARLSGSIQRADWDRTATRTEILVYLKQAAAKYDRAQAETVKFEKARQEMKRLEHHDRNSDEFTKAFHAFNRAAEQYLEVVEENAPPKNYGAIPEKVEQADATATSYTLARLYDQATGAEPAATP